MNVIGTTEAAEQKGVSRQAVIDAISRGAIDGKRVSQRTLIVIENDRFREWRPNPVRQAAGKTPKER